MAGNTDNTPIPDAELAELRRLHAAANGSPRDYSAPVMRSAMALYEAFPRLLARLEAAEREQQRVHELANRLLDANNGLIDTIRKLDPEALCDWHDSIGGDEYLQRWLAARDAQQRREGAIEALEGIAKDHGVDGGKAYIAKVVYREFPDLLHMSVGVVDAADLMQAAKRLRESD